MPLLPNELDIIYDRFGAAQLRLLKNGRIVTWPGEHIGILKSNQLYNYSGHHVGWYEGGILRDLNGNTVGFGVNPTDAPRPFLPFKQWLPPRGYVGFAPTIPWLGWPNWRPFKSYGWSSYDPISLFGENNG